MEKSKIQLGQFPTPLYEIKSMKDILPNHKLFIKRDDLTGVALGGNKVRKLEYILYRAIKDGYNYFLTTGGPQSNHALLTVACCRKIGKPVELFLKGAMPKAQRGNLFLGKLLDSKVTFVETSSYGEVYKAMKNRMAVLEKEGYKPFLIPVGGSMKEGMAGYVTGIDEGIKQLKQIGETVDHVVVCLGSGGTYGGTLLGAKLIDKNIKVTGIAVSHEEFTPVIEKLIEDGAAEFKLDNPVKKEDIKWFDYTGKDYAIPTREGNEAIKIMALREGIILDPVYTGKTFGAILDLASKGYFKEDKSILFIHTGGAGSVFAFEENFN